MISDKNFNVLCNEIYRRRFPATVNCWFCNENTKIPYDDLNKWTCKKCEQYNGFTEVVFDF